MVVVDAVVGVVVVDVLVDPVPPETVVVLVVPPDPLGALPVAVGTVSTYCATADSVVVVSGCVPAAPAGETPTHSAPATTSILRPLVVWDFPMIGRRMRADESPEPARLL